MSSSMCKNGLKDHSESSGKTNLPLPVSFDDRSEILPPDNDVREQIQLDGHQLSLDAKDKAELIDKLCKAAHTYIRSGSYGMGIQAQQLALKLSYRHFGYGSERYIEVLFWVGLYFHKLLRYKQAERIYLLVLRNRKQSLGYKNPQLSPYLNNMGRLYKDTERYKPAEKLLLQSLRYEQKISPNSTNVADRLNNLASLYTKQGKYSLALDYSLQALAIFSTSNHHHRDEHVALMQNNLAALYIKLGQLPQAEILLEAALQYRLDTSQHQVLELASVYINYYQLAFMKQDYHSALDYGRRCLRISYSAYGTSNILYAQALMSIGDVFCHLDRRSAALSLWTRAETIMKQVVSPKHPSRIKIAERLFLAQDWEST